MSSTPLPVGSPLWLQIATTLSQDILAHQLTGRLPNEQALAARFTVNRHTIRQAVQHLKDRGLVRIERGRGTFVQEDMIAYRLGRNSRFSHSLTVQHLVGSVAIQSHQAETASDAVCALLQLPAGSSVLRVESLDLANGEVVSVCTQYFPLPRFTDFRTVYRNSSSTSDAFRQMGIARFSRVLSRVSARMPRLEVAQALQMGRQQPVLYVESVYADESGQPIEYGITRFPGDRVQIEVTPDTL
ncbi:phosphonate metabolism transcriptional regulator PhnF [Leeia aquatica]|uniref:Phosphonate metabolism transcriptional regulator PhnF n=1 Tax=Leeia aquatica TaxID=2725557 RepID=A0A847S5Q6_9NEIS|nr:phosphonate metabolism transcriptional regulator PhnF [Leeia aquatica]NLR75103.1 phosphonate metabolism transcriptional regulator PhnF [Leeia aquatica]